MLRHTAAQALGLIEDESGATAIEYGFMLLLIGVAIIAALTSLGVALDAFFQKPGNTIGSAL